MPTNIMSKVYNLKKVQVLPTTLERAWDFFSLPENLKTITAPHPGFQILSEKFGEKMFAGQLIEYTVKPLLGIPIYWMTEITQVEPLKFFIDEQRYGTYSFWHHQHHFKQVDGGVEMTDIVHYKIHFWFLGDIVNTILVKSELEKIFNFRKELTDRTFGK